MNIGYSGASNIAEAVMINTNKIFEICEKQEIKIPALKQLEAAQQLNSTEDVERIGNNIIAFLKERELWKNSTNPPARNSIFPTRISAVPDRISYSSFPKERI